MIEEVDKSSLGFAEIDILTGDDLMDTEESDSNNVKDVMKWSMTWNSLDLLPVLLWVVVLLLMMLRPV